jgi:Flp pilus assembly protein TadG
MLRELYEEANMQSSIGAEIRHLKSFGRIFSKFLKCNRANIAIMFAFMAPMFVGGLGLGVETGLWYVDQRNMQNASDAAAMAAGADATSANYANVANAVAAQYGFTNGVNGVTVTPSNTATCPSGGNNCYSVAITMKQPIYLLPAVGYSGNTTLNGQAAQTIQASAIASANGVTHQYCLLTLSTSSSSLGTNGAPKANLAGCSVMSNGGATCHGHNLGADYGDAAGTNSGCGVSELSNVPTVSDPYAHLASNIPSNPCSSYPQEPGKHGTPLPGSNQWTGTLNLSGNTIICGDLQLTGDTTINAPAGTTIVIENGQLDSGSYTLQTANGSTATIVFSGTNSGSYTHAPTGGGTLNIQAPTSGPWSGVAIYQDPSITSGVDISAAGNSPTWDITGLVYLPNSNVTLSGAVDKSANGAACIVLVSYTLQINGTGDILKNGGCAAAGLAMPSNQVGGRGLLVY